jgi:hypothetical protein
MFVMEPPKSKQFDLQSDNALGENLSMGIMEPMYINVKPSKRLNNFYHPSNKGLSK